MAALAATPLVTAFVLNGIPLARNSTSPVGVPDCELMVAVKDRLCPYPDGLDGEVNKTVAIVDTMLATVSAVVLAT